MRLLLKHLMAVLALTAFTGCANMTAQQKNTAVGAAIGVIWGRSLRRTAP